MINKRNGVTHDNDTVISDYIHKYGNAASIALLHPLCKVFDSSLIDGIIGYRAEKNCAIALGDPICAANDRIALAAAFHDFCQQKNESSIYAMTSEAFTNDLLSNFGGSTLQFGHEIIIDPTIDTRNFTGNYPHHLRQKYKHAILHGLSFSEYKESNIQIEQTLTTIAQEWLSNRKGAQIYVLPIDVFAHRLSKRWFYAQKDNKIVGFLMLNRIEACQGWVLNGSIMLTAEAPNSCSEFLMLCTLDTLRNEGCHYFSAGPTMSKEIERIQGFGWFSEFIINCGVKSARAIFKMNDRQRYWKKFQARKEPSFVTFTSSRIGLREICALFRAFNVHL